MSGHWSDWLCWFGGWALAVGGAVVLVWAVVGDRSRGRRRCRGCWYDMGSIREVEGVWVCPECGKRAGRERLLLRSRRRWRWAGVAVLMLVVAYPAYSAPTIRRDGWVTAVPSVVLARVAPIGDNAWSKPPGGFDSGRVRWGGYSAADARDPWLVEIVNRINDDEARGRAFRLLIHRFLQAHPRFNACEIRTRDRWVAGLPVYCTARYPFDRELPFWVDSSCRVRMTGGAWTQWRSELEQVQIGTAPQQGAFHIEYEVAFDGVTMIRGGTDPIEVTASIDDVMTAVPSEAYAWFEPTPSLPPPVSLRIDSNDKLQVGARGVLYSEFWQRATAAYEFEIWRGDDRVAQGNHIVDQDPFRQLGGWLPEVRPRILRPRSPFVSPSDEIRVWVVRVRDDPILALVNYESNARWVGELVLYFEEVRERPCEFRLLDIVVDQ